MTDEQAQVCTCAEPAAPCPACLARRDRHGFPKDWRERMRRPCPTCIHPEGSDPVVRDDGSIGWVIVHHSLDGREASESPGHVDRRARERAEQAMAEHEPCTDCVRCETCRREWCPTVVARCPGEESWWRHPTGGYGGDDQAYCYRCTVCPGGYFQFHLDAYPACTEVQQAPHVIADGKGWD